MAGFYFGISQFMKFAFYALSFYIGALLVRYDDLNPGDMYTAIFSIFFSSVGMGNNA